MESNPASATSNNKTSRTGADPVKFIQTVDTTAVRREDAFTLMTLMHEVTGQSPYMWGPSIIGFGEYHYTYASGREGDAPAVAFSPRKANLVVYGLSYPTAAQPLLAKLGKFKASVACVYITKLADVDMAVLRELIALTYDHSTTTAIQSLQSQRK
ncbi:hypothetical protein AS189_02295 [Arthrobacter alpinus]|uniref:YdhG-like domain-containing protein n=1 Tax=Arthrobacter alpinus TaxID=656366 RepID=A0A0S2LW14_9MICC|nr:DUF1801 domain-containing protein [Arthrobacter alpinus]ALO65537.1 hypothetical protein AS189_02295 [Arthrobacter alpinus]